MKYLLQLAYKGTRFHGWQRQPHVISVQEVLEDTLERMVGYKINCIGCGRTDTGVHASQFYCHIVIKDAFSYDPVFRLNKMLPDDISIFECEEVARGLHAQHDAVERKYTYRIHTRKDALLSEISAYYPMEGMNIKQMREATALLLKYNDYRSFCKQPDLYKNTLCDIREASLSISKDQRQLQFDISADRFLRGMVRLIVGNILEVGYGRLSIDEFEHFLKSGEMMAYYKAAYPQGLYLSGVKYKLI